ncbi:MAG: FecR domain-containing protein [Candidatus Lindowbacteria bacterium]|nr:FecR domain-containing protein [Candidatus Lindowbacteria bacterium]
MCDLKIGIKKLLLCLIVMGLFFAVPTLPADAKRPEFGILIKARGKVKIKPAGSKNWYTATERMRIKINDVVRTGPKSTAVIKLSKKNIIVLKEKSEFSLDKAEKRITKSKGKVFGTLAAVQNEYEYEVSLNRGTAVSVLKGLKGNSSFDLKTPVAVAGVRGTVFPTMVTLNKNGQIEANFGCFEGSIEVKGTTSSFQGIQIINPGEHFSVMGFADDQGPDDAFDDEEGFFDDEGELDDEEMDEEGADGDEGEEMDDEGEDEGEEGDELDEGDMEDVFDEEGFDEADFEAELDAAEEVGEGFDDIDDLVDFEEFDEFCEIDEFGDVICHEDDPEDQ